MQTSRSKEISKIKEIPKIKETALKKGAASIGNALVSSFDDFGDPLVFEGGALNLVDYSPNDEDILMTRLGIQENDLEGLKTEGLAVIAAHTNLIFNLRLRESVHIHLLELNAAGKISLGRLTKLSDAGIFWDEPSKYRKDVSGLGKASIPNNSVSNESTISEVFKNIQDISEKGIRQLSELGLCETQIDALFPKTRIIKFAWSICLSDIFRVIKLVDDETVVWEVRSLGMKLEHLVVKLFPSLSAEFVR